MQGKCPPPLSGPDLRMFIPLSELSHIPVMLSQGSQMAKQQELIFAHMGSSEDSTLGFLLAKQILLVTEPYIIWTLGIREKSKEEGL